MVCIKEVIKLVIRRVTFRLYPNNKATKKLLWARRMHKDLYNSAIANRDTQYKKFGRSISYFDQQNSLPALKEELTEYKKLASQSLQDTLKRKASRQLRRKRSPNHKKKVKGSKRWKKARKRVSDIQADVANKRKDWQHKVTTLIVSGNSLVATEKLNIKGMTSKAKKARKASRKKQKTGLNRAILDVGIASMIGMLRYKLEECGGFLIEVPTKKVKPSQTCPCCGHQRKKELSERVHLCSECGYTNDRDVAAAMVMLSWALGISVLNRGDVATTSKPSVHTLWVEASGIEEATETV
jgi:IS605 OrfB family transposase